MRNESDYRLFRLVNFVIALLVLYGTHGVAFAEDRRNGGPTPSAEGAAVHFIDLKDGQTVPPKVTVRFGLREMGVAPAGLGSRQFRTSPPADRHRVATSRSAHSQRLQPSALWCWPDRGGSHLETGSTHTAVASGGQGSHSTQPAGHVAAHSRVSDGRGGPQRNRLGRTYASYASPEYSKALSLLSTISLLLTAAAARPYCLTPSAPMRSLNRACQSCTIMSA